MPERNQLGLAVNFRFSAEFIALTEKQKTEFNGAEVRGFCYAMGRLDQGHPVIASLETNRAPSAVDTQMAFGALYARMLLDFIAAGHPRRSALSIQSAWRVFAETGCPDGSLPLRLS